MTDGSRMEYSSGHWGFGNGASMTMDRKGGGGAKYTWHQSIYCTLLQNTPVSRRVCAKGFNSIAPCWGARRSAVCPCALRWTVVPPCRQALDAGQCSGQSRPMSRRVSTGSWHGACDICPVSANEGAGIDCSLPPAITCPCHLSGSGAFLRQVPFRTMSQAEPKDKSHEFPLPLRNGVPSASEPLARAAV
jgi:hypothetical protein